MRKVGTFLEVTDVGGVGSGLQLDPPGFEVHPDVDFHLFVNRSVDFKPCLLQGSVSVWWNRDFAELDLAVGDFVRLKGPEVGLLGELNGRLARRIGGGFDVHRGRSGVGADGGGAFHVTHFADGALRSFFPQMNRKP